MSAYELSFGKSGWRAGDDPFLVAEEIDIADVKLRAFRVPLTQARAVIRSDVVERFETETDPEGNPWAEWSESYRPRAERENVGILRKESAHHEPAGTPSLFEAVSDLSTYAIRSRGISQAAIGGGDIALVGSNLPDYWVYHQDGTSNMPARPFFGVSEEAEATIYTIFDDHVDRSLAGMVRRTGQPIIRTERGPRFARYYS
jgi:hypothetical protein